MIKIVKTGPDGLIENRVRSAPADRGTTSASATHIIRVPPKSTADPSTDPGSMSRGRPNTFTRQAARDRTARGRQRLAAARTTHVPRPTYRPTRKLTPRRPRFIGQNLSSVRPRPNTKTRPRSFRPAVADHDPTTGRTDRPNVRSTRSRF
ncbi:unnamed protein product [Microthlaspi erraticum]|uniref:Uncharacterized protein n=1 Tax=Microthlaspi erraticum TaxID=1685480 RepID=A0A6D2JXR1_9BRAS|nr:unnamed protein product [Microthlaspi erraticum]